MTLIERLRWYYERDCNKHELAPDTTEYANDKINVMSNVELAEAISDALNDAGITWQELG